jgi:DNA-binding MarR family transcriptional regulator
MHELTAATEIERWTRLVMRKWHSEIGCMLREGLPAPQYYLLEALRKDGILKCSDLAEALQITLPAVTNLANKLVAGGYAQRIQAASDRRLVLLQITDRGLEALKDLDEKAAKQVERMWKALEADEVAELTRLFQKAASAKKEAT